jgi:hypothetical protein
VRIDLLGVEMDLLTGRMRLGKRERYAASCRAVSIRQSGVPLTEFRELLGKLTFASIVYPKGRQWVAPCWRSFKISLKRSPVQKVFITRHVREALQRWAVELEDPEHVGVPMACREWVPQFGTPGVGVIYADASGEEGWAAWTFVSGVVWLVHVRHVQVETARKYFGEALSAHTSFYGPPVPGYNMPRVRKMIKGMAKVIDAPPRRPRRAVRTQDLKEALDGLPVDSVSAVNARACASVGFCGLLRAAEMSLQRGQVWSKARSLSRADVSFLVRPGVGRPAEWVPFDKIERGSKHTVVAAKVMMRPCKKLRYRGDKTVPVFLFDGSSVGRNTLWSPPR